MAFPILGTPKPQFFTSSGAPLTSGTLSILEPADDTNKASYPTYDDAEAATNANDNPLTLDSRGEPATGLWGLDGQDYKVVLKDSSGATIWNADDIFLGVIGPDGQQTTNEATASVTPTNVEYPEYDLRRYGAALDGSTDDQAAIEKVMKVIVANGGGTLTFPPGTNCVCASSIPELSLMTGYNGGYSGPIARSFTVMAEGATINYTGTGFMFQFQGTTISATAPRRINFTGGSWIGTSSGGGLIKGRDCNRAAIQPEMVSNFSTGRAILLQNWYNWSENITLSGPGGSTLTFTDNLIGLEVQGVTAATAEDGTPGGSPGESFARLRAFNISYGSASGAPVNNRIFKVGGSWYDGMACNVRGNMTNRDSGATKGTTALVEITANGAMTRTLIDDWKFEGAAETTGDQAYIVDASAAGLSDQAYPRMGETWWTFAVGVTPPEAYDTANWGVYTKNASRTFHTTTKFDAEVTLAEIAVGSITAALTGSVDDWEPTGIGRATILALTSDGAYNITGMAGGREGRILLIHNDSSFNLTLKDGDAGSVTATNRFDLGGQDRIIRPEGAALLAYETDTGADRWKVVTLYGGLTDLSSSGTTGGAASAGAGNQYVELKVGGTTYKVLHDGTV